MTYRLYQETGARHGKTAPTLTVDYTSAGVTGAAPEPATWAMMLLGFGGLGHALRRRHGATTRIRLA